MPARSIPPITILDVWRSARRSAISRGKRVTRRPLEFSHGFYYRSFGGNSGYQQKRRGRENDSRMPEPPKYPVNPCYEVHKEKDSFRVIVSLPYHFTWRDFEYRVIGDVLHIKSRLMKYYREFLIPKNYDFRKSEVIFNNAVLQVRFQAK